MASSVTELIWHFAGYLRLPPDAPFNIKLLYDGAAHGPSDEPPLKFTPEHHHYDVNIGPIIGPSYFRLPEPNPYLWRLTHLHPDQKHSHPTIHLPHFSSHPSYEPPPSAGGGGGAVHSDIFVTYQTGGDDNLINVHQINDLTSDNQMNAPADVFAGNQAAAGDAISSMLQKAALGTPFYEEPASNDTTGLQNWVNARDASPAHSQAMDAPFSTSDGQYVDGSTYSGTGNVHQLTNDVLNNVGQGLIQGFGGGIAPPSGNGMGLSDQTTSVGENILANQAVVASFAGGTAALAVMGNYNETNAIIQTNVFKEVNHFSGEGGSVTLDPNIATNIADFQNIVPTLTGGGSGGDGSVTTFAPWHVSVLNGSFLDVHSFTQTNYLNNDNVVYQQASGGIDQYVLGNNELVNTAQLQNFGSNYNLIIVEGSYHQDNLLCQTNVVLDSSDVTFGGLAGGAQSVRADGNTIVNDGSIITDQNQTFQPFNQSALDVVNSLTHEKTSLDPNVVNQAFPGFLSGLNVLVVTGDYYDVNYVSQMNVLANANVVHMHGAGAANAQQNLITGHNEVVNAATLIDAGSATSPYLQGDHYSDMILFQTNIIGGQANISGQDPTQLAPELAAFVTNEPAQQLPTGPAAPQADLNHHVNHNSSDVLAGVMH